jgi:hypothetical protein
VLGIAEKHWGNPTAACEEIVAAAYQYWATEDTRSDDVTCIVLYFTPKAGAAMAVAVAPEKASSAAWGKLRSTVQATVIRNRPALRFANAVLAEPLTVCS